MRAGCMLLLIASLAAAADWRASKAEGDRRYQAGEYEAALREYNAALADAPAGSTEAAELQLDVGKVLALRGDYADARSRGEQALQTLERAHGPEHPAVARALSTIGMALSGAGDYSEAQPYLERALAIRRKTSAGTDAAAVSALQDLAFNISRMGDYRRVRSTQEETVATAERSLGPDHPLTLQAQRVLSQILVEAGDYPSAERIQLRALAALEQRSGRDDVEVANLLVTMGNGAKDAGSHKTAEDYLLRAVAIYEKRLGPRNTRVAGALDNLGQDYVAMGRFEDARRVFEHALEIQRAELGPRHPWTGNLIQGLAKVEAGLGKYAKARELYEQNLDIWREKLGPSHPFTVVSLTLLADVQAHLGDYGAALDTALGAATIRRDDIALTVQGVDERQALRYADLHTASMDTALTLAAREGTTATEATRVWDALIRSRALVLDEMGERHRSIQQSGSPEVAELARRVTAARSRIARVVVQGRGGMSPKDYAAAIESARVELEAAEYALAQKSAAFRHTLDQRHAGFADVRAALPPGSALVAYRRYKRANYSAARVGALDSYIAFVLPGAGREPIAVPLGSAARIEELVGQWRAEIDRESDAMGRAARANEQQYRAAALALRAAAWDPVVRRVSGARRVYVVPDGALQLVNFAALPAGQNGYVAETGPLLHLLSAERDLTAPASAAEGTELLAVANPDFAALAGRASASFRGSRSTCGDFARLQFGALPASRQEVDAIAAIWRGRGWHALELSGSQASEAAVKESAANKRVVHLATHAFFLEANCPETGIGRENPLLRSGLALSGANRRQQAGGEQEDGVLTAEEAASLNLQAAEWVVLSGCDTGVGDVRTGEGVLGLRRAFLEAGAHTLIASLWPVGDEDARRWMTSLYRARFVARRSTIEAIRDASVQQLRERRTAGRSTHPFYWAGFVAVGDWR
jgi:CHAT domain-containing protein/Tfp pilus assembly protein PilF